MAARWSLGTWKTTEQLWASFLMSWPKVHCESHVFSVSPQKVPASHSGQCEVFTRESGLLWHLLLLVLTFNWKFIFTWCAKSDKLYWNVKFQLKTHDFLKFVTCPLCCKTIWHEKLKTISWQCSDSSLPVIVWKQVVYKRYHPLSVISGCWFNPFTLKAWSCSLETAVVLVIFTLISIKWGNKMSWVPLVQYGIWW